VESEFYVVNLVKSDEEARSLVSKFLGLPAALTGDQVVNALAQRRTIWNLTLRLRCNPSEVFSALRRLLDRTQTPIDPLTNDDFYWLMSQVGRDAIGQLLRCSPDEALQRLFAPEQIAQLLMQAGVASEQEVQTAGSDSGSLLNRFLSKEAHPRIEEFSGTGNRWELLHELLRDQARQELAQALNSSQEEILRYLVAHIKASTQAEPTHVSRAAFGQGEGFDFIGLSKLRGLMHRFQYALIEMAKSQAAAAKGRLPGFRVAALLPAMILFHTGRQFKAALEEMLGTTQPLRQMGFRVEPLEAAGMAGRPKTSRATEPMKASIPELVLKEAPLDTQAVEGMEGREVVVRYHSPQTQQPVEILRLRGLKREDADHIQQHLPRKVGDLTLAGITLLDRVLNTQFPLFSRWKRKLREALARPNDLKSIDDAFVQCFVLSGAGLDPGAVDRNLKVCTYIKTDYSPTARVEFPKSARDIVELLQAEYSRQGQDLKLV
jgi:hypothetical protein